MCDLLTGRRQHPQERSGEIEASLCRSGQCEAFGLALVGSNVGAPPAPVVFPKLSPDVFERSVPCEELDCMLELSPRCRLFRHDFALVLGLCVCSFGARILGL